MLAQFRPHSSANAERIEFSKKLVKLLREKDMNQSDLARKMGFSRDAVSSWVRARSMPEPKNLEALAKALGVEVRDLTLPIAHDPTRIPPSPSADPGPQGQGVVNLSMDPAGKTAALYINATLSVEQAMAVIQAYQKIVDDAASD